MTHSVGSATILLVEGEEERVATAVPGGLDVSACNDRKPARGEGGRVTRRWHRARDASLRDEASTSFVSVGGGSVPHSPYPAARASHGRG